MRALRLGLLALFLPALAQAWDAAGHMLVGEIAWQQMTPAAREKAAALVQPLDTRFTEGRPYNFITAGCWMDDMRGLGRDFYHQVVTGAQVENYISKGAGRNLEKVFDQYLRDTNIPVLQYRFTKGKVEYRWSDCVDGFDMPVKVTLKKDVYEMIYPTTEWKSSPIKLGKKGKFMVDEDFYVFSEMLTTGK